MKKIFLVTVLLLSGILFAVNPVNADEIDVPADDPVLPEYTQLAVSTTYGTPIWYYVNGAAIKVRPRVTSGIVRYGDGYTYNYSCHAYADILGFDSEIYTSSQIHAELLDIGYEYNQSTHTLKCSFYVRVYAGDYSNYYKTPVKKTLTLNYVVDD